MGGADYRPIMAMDGRLVGIQNDVREHFGWSLRDDLRVCRELVGLSRRLHGSDAWVEKTVHHLRMRLESGGPIAILGAAVEPEHLRGLADDTLLVAADGSVGVFSELTEAERDWAWERLALVVSDGDGGESILTAVERGIPFAVHAHGDNLEECTSLLKCLHDNGNRLFLTHQCPEQVGGIENPGGFTDGDRAVCIVAGLRENCDDVHLLGFRSDRIGRWTGATDEGRKLRKLKWMDAVLAILGEVGR